MPLVYAGMAAIALMAVPVVAGPHGPETALGGQYIQDPVLGVVSAFHPHWLAEIMRWVVALVAAPVLFWAATTSMLGVSRHTYTLAINRQIPSWLGKLHRRRATPYVAITICGLIALGLVIPTNIKMLAGLYAFGATLAITIAHLSIIRLRVTMPDKKRPFRIPWGMAWGPAELPIPAMIAALASFLAFLSVLAFHTTARWVGIGWMAFGLLFYVVYRKYVEGTSLTKRVSVGEAALTKQIPEVEFSNLLVPVFGTKLDDDIVATAGRLAAAESEDADGEGESRLELDLRDRGAADRAARRRAAAGARGAGAAGAGAGARGGGGVRGRRGLDRGDPRPQNRGRDRRGGAPPQLGGDRDRRRAAEQDPRRRQVRRDRRGAARRDRRGDRVRAQKSPLPGAAHGAAGAGKRARRRGPRGHRDRRRRRPGPLGHALRSSIRRMFILIVGCGRVGSSVARAMLREGHTVSALDEDPESHARLEVGLEKSWEDLGGQFTVGAGLEAEALEAAGIDQADVFIASTDGDNTNIIISQIAKRRYGVPNVIARVLDPLRAEWYARQGLQTVCPTRVAIDMLETAVRDSTARPAAGSEEAPESASDGEA